MSSNPDAAVAIRVLSPITDDDWACAELLIAELKEWDVQQSRALGFDEGELIDVFYPDGIEQIRRQSALPDGCFAVAMDASVPAGCAGFRRLSPNRCELFDVYVRPGHRGRGIGSALVRRLLQQARAAGYEAMCLETASFMLTAHKLYKSLHFQVREPYRRIPARFADVTMWMECRLDGHFILEEQIEYYRARAAEYDQWYLRQGRYDRGPELNQRWFAQDREILGALSAFRPSGSVLELACGTGIWTARLLPYARELVAVDTSPEVIAINRARVLSQNVTYVQADVFAWTPPRQFDVVFFGFWLSHVPPERFDAFWALVRQALKPEGRFFFVDSRYEPTSTAKDLRLPDRAATTLMRRLNDGREFQIYKIYYDGDALKDRLAQIGWSARIWQTTDYFLYGWGTPSPSCHRASVEQS